MGVSGGNNITWELKGIVGVDWINLALNRDKWLVLIEEGTEISFSILRRISGLNNQLIAS